MSITPCLRCGISLSLWIWGKYLGTLWIRVFMIKTGRVEQVCLRNYSVMTLSTEVAIDVWTSLFSLFWYVDLFIDADNCTTSLNTHQIKPTHNCGHSRRIFMVVLLPVIWGWGISQCAQKKDSIMEFLDRIFTQQRNVLNEILCTLFKMKRYKFSYKNSSETRYWSLLRSFIKVMTYILIT